MTRHDDIAYPSSIGLLLVHLGCLAVVWTGVTWRAVALGLALYALHIFAVGAGYHRYFAHRAFSTSRFCHFVLAVHFVRLLSALLGPGGYLLA